MSKDNKDGKCGLLMKIMQSAMEDESGIQSLLRMDMEKLFKGYEERLPKKVKRKYLECRIVELDAENRSLRCDNEHMKEQLKGIRVNGHDAEALRSEVQCQRETIANLIRSSESMAGWIGQLIKQRDRLNRAFWEVAIYLEKRSNATPVLFDSLLKNFCKEELYATHKDGTADDNQAVASTGSETDAGDSQVRELQCDDDPFFPGRGECEPDRGTERGVPGNQRPEQETDAG